MILQEQTSEIGKNIREEIQEIVHSGEETQEKKRTCSGMNSGNRYTVLGFVVQIVKNLLNKITSNKVQELTSTVNDLENCSNRFISGFDSKGINVTHFVSTENKHSKDSFYVYVFKIVSGLGQYWIFSLL